MAKPRKRRAAPRKDTLPKELDIAGHTISVVVDEHLIDRSGCLGQYHDSRNLIVLAPGAPDSLVSETLLHEVVEAINAKAELRLEHPQIQTLALLLHQALATAR